MLEPQNKRKLEAKLRDLQRSEPFGVQKTVTMACGTTGAASALLLHFVVAAASGRGMLDTAVALCARYQEMQPQTHK